MVDIIKISIQTEIIKQLDENHHQALHWRGDTCRCGRDNYDKTTERVIGKFVLKVHGCGDEIHAACISEKNTQR